MARAVRHDRPAAFLCLALAGWLSCWLYRRVKNLWALGLGHALLSWTISSSPSEEATFGMRVGPGCWGYFEALRQSTLLF